ncbi:flippase [Amylibacter sp.]|nr:flippase [Amylibacter sp.]MDB2443204.1 flippase [Amylibacter sp.]
MIRFNFIKNQKKIFYNFSWLFFERILNFLINIYLSVTIAYYFGPSDFGTISFLNSVVAILSTFALLGLPAIIVRDIVVGCKPSVQTMGSAVALVIASSIITYIILILIVLNTALVNEVNKLLLLILSVKILFNFCEIFISWFEAKVLSKYVVWGRSIITILFFFIKLYAVFYHTTLNILFIVMALETFVTSIFIILLMDRYGLKLYHLKLDINLAKTLFKDALPLLIGGLVILLHIRIDQIMLQQMLGAKSVGIYSAGVKISEALYFIPIILSASVFPNILRSKNISKEEYYKKLQKLFDISFVMSLVLSIIIILSSGYIIQSLFGEEYQDSASITAIHAFGLIFVSFGVISGKWFIAEGLQIFSLQRNLFALIINVFLNYFLIPEFGIIGAASTTIISQAFACFIFDILFKKTRIIFWMKCRSLNLMRYANYRSAT